MHRADSAALPQDMFRKARLIGVSMILKSVLTVCVGMLLVGCSLNEGSSEVDASSEALQSSSNKASPSSSSEALQSSSNKALPSSSSRNQEPDTEFRNLNVIVDYLHDSAWEISAVKRFADGNRGPIITLWSYIDTVVLWKVRGDTLELSSIRYDAYNGSGFMGIAEFECYLSQGSCAFDDSLSEYVGPSPFWGMTIGNMRSPAVLWKLAESDSAVIWDQAWGASLDPKVAISPAGVVYTVNGASIKIKAIPRPSLQAPKRLPSDSARLFLIADYIHDSRWVKNTTVVTGGTLSSYSIDTIEVLERSKDSLILFVHGVFCNGPLQPRADTVVQFLKEGYVLRSKDNPLVLEISEPSAENVDLFFKLAKQDSVFLWSEDIGISSLHSEKTVDYEFQGFNELGLNKKDYRFDKDGFEYDEEESPMPLFGGFYKKTYSLKTLR